jgi:hypothetical protein
LGGSFSREWGGSFGRFFCLHSLHYSGARCVTYGHVVAGILQRFHETLQNTMALEGSKGRRRETLLETTPKSSDLHFLFQVSCRRKKMTSTHFRLCCAVSPCFPLPIYSTWQSTADHLQRQVLSAWRLESPSGLGAA